jgi:hypothetical protein
VTITHDTPTASAIAASESSRSRVERDARFGRLRVTTTLYAFRTMKKKPKSKRGWLKRSNSNRVTVAAGGATTIGARVSF